MRTKSEIKEKLNEAEKMLQTAVEPEKSRLDAVTISLRWVLEQKIYTQPKDPIYDE